MRFQSPCLTAVLLCAAVSAHAAEGFQVRYNLAGSLGGEMFAPPDTHGFAMGAAATCISVDRITGGDGRALRTTTPGGTVAVPGLPSSLYPSYGSNQVESAARGTLTLYNLAAAYISEARFGGGRLAWLVNVPYGIKAQRLAGKATPPSLSWPDPTTPDAATQGAVQQQFSSQYMAAVNGAAAAETGKAAGIGDVELQGGWLYADEQWRVLAGASIAMPTGRYQSAAGPDIGNGNFYTLRPAVQAAWLPRADLSVAGKLTVGINTRNKDTGLRSGNWVGLETALAYMTPIGPVGLHSVHVQQTQDDGGNPLGSARFRSNNVGLFFTTKLPVIDAVVTVQTMKTTDSRYAKHGTFQQIRVIKVF